MKFTRKLTYDEIRNLTKEEDMLYIKWIESENRAKNEKRRENWTFQNWADEAFTMNCFLAARRDFFLEEETIDKLVEKRLKEGQEEKFTFFWETKSPFSQWHKSEFIGPSYMWDNAFMKRMIEEGYPKERNFKSAEQWMMYCKAMLFMDFEMADNIMSTSNPRKMKEFGRQVKRFDPDTWRVYRWRFIMQGNRLKFDQNPTLRKALLETKGTTLVEAAPNDVVWGIGLTSDDERSQARSTWKGMNLLGEILTELRIQIDGEY